jgi:uncharacterized protein YqgV (UPF0045/DUF77 family)
MAQAETTRAASTPETPPLFGARISLYPMTDRYVPIIQNAIKGLDETGLEVETDDMSTFIGGDRDQVFAQLERVFAAAALTGEHVVMTVLLSHGCPGETYCEATGEVRPPRTAPPARSRSGVIVTCQWSLYPLGIDSYMDVIYREIDRTRKAGVFTRGQHFVSTLQGDLTETLGAVRASFDAACADAGHVVVHATFSANSPTGRS